MEQDTLAVTLAVFFILGIGAVSTYFSTTITGNQIILFEQTHHCPLADKFSCDTCCDEVGGRIDGAICRASAAPSLAAHNEQVYNTCIQNFGFEAYLTK